MAKANNSRKPLKPPRFRGEAEEARWWYRNQKQLADEFQKAASAGKLDHGSVARRGGIPTTTIRLDPRDIARARALASRKGLRYQTYLKMLLHEALEAEERAG